MIYYLLLIFYILLAKYIVNYLFITKFDYFHYLNIFLITFNNISNFTYSCSCNIYINLCFYFAFEELIFLNSSSFTPFYINIRQHSSKFGIYISYIFYIGLYVEEDAWITFFYTNILWFFVDFIVFIKF
jgi:hypothetical protein